MLVIELENGVVSYASTFAEAMALVTDPDMESDYNNCHFRGVAEHAQVKGVGAEALILDAHKEEALKAVGRFITEFRRLYLQTMQDEIELKTKAEIARRIIDGSASVADHIALSGEASDRNENVETLAALICCKARWADLAAAESSRIQLRVREEIRQSDSISTLNAIDTREIESPAEHAALYQQKTAIAYSVCKMMMSDPERDNASWWTTDGKPQVDQLKERAGIPVTASLRDEVWTIESQFV